MNKKRNLKNRSLPGLFALLILAVLFTGCGSGGEEESAPEVQEETATIVRKPAKPAEEQKAEEEAASFEKDDVLYIVQEMRTDEEKIVLTSTETERNYLYPYSLSTRFLDKYGQNTSSLNFTVGSVVTIGDKLPSQALSYVQKAADVWEYTDVSNYSIDPELEMITVGDEKYRLTSSTVVYSNDIIGSLNDIGEDDILQIIGKDKKVITISVTTGHGYLALANTAKFEDSLLCIGNKIFTMVTPDMTVTVPEGTYMVTAANDGYGGSMLVEIRRNETTLLDMAELEGEGPKVCKLTLNCTVEGAEIFVDRNPINAGEETEIAYGRHTLAVTAEGYDRWEKTLFVNSETATLTVDPTEGEKSKSSDDEDNDSNSSSDNNSNNSNNSNNNNNNNGNSGNGNSGTNNTGNTNNNNNNNGNNNSANTNNNNAVNNNTGNTNANNTNNTNNNTNTNTSYGANNNTNNTNNNSSSSTSSRDAELDYLSTLSNMISVLGGSSD